MEMNLKRISLSIGLGLSIAFSWLQPLDTSAIIQVDAGLKRALIAFATADILSVDQAYFDHSIWQFMSKGGGVSQEGECDGYRA